MINANELRLGNLVQFAEDGTNFSVVSIGCDGLDVKNQYEHTWIEIDQFGGIPLTEEWLLRFGFELSYKSEWVVRYSLKSNHKFTYKYNIPEGKSWLEYHGGAIDCIHVHHMQNIIYALTQTELEIETLQV